MLLLFLQLLLVLQNSKYRAEDSSVQSKEIKSEIKIILTNIKNLTIITLKPMMWFFKTFKYLVVFKGSVDPFVIKIECKYF